jgi:signal transduction histidine kinase
LEAFRLSRGAGAIQETPDGLEVGATVVPARRSDPPSRALWVRYLPPGRGGRGPIPQLALIDLVRRPVLAEQFRDRVVFIGVTAPSAAKDRLMTPFSYGQTMPGVEIHANIFETLARGRFLSPAPESRVLLFCLLLTVVIGVTFAKWSGWRPYGIGIVLLAAAHLVPWILFRRGSIFPYSPAVSTAWMSIATAATYQHFVVRRMLRKSESERARYRQAIHFVTHEMRTPLTAIQGSSELIGRYNLPEEKRRQIADMINAESKRLARMIQNFLDMERLTEGELDMKREPFRAAEIMESCVARAAVLAERKRIEIRMEPLPGDMLHGDRELMEYAFYNLLTNAVKYSPADTVILVFGRREGDTLRFSVKDQGIGIDEKELGSIFKKFYRTKRAEASGEAGTGIGLSLVEQIVSGHRGRMEVTSSPGKGSCFTIVLPASVSAFTTETR